MGLRPSTIRSARCARAASQPLAVRSAEAGTARPPRAVESHSPPGPRPEQVADTQQLGNGIIETLGAQRDQIRGAIGRQDEMDSMLTRSNKLIRTM